MANRTEIQLEGRPGGRLLSAWRRHRASIFRAYLVGTIVIFLVIAVVASMVPYFFFDVAVARAIQSVHATWFAELMFWVSWIGFAPQAWLISAVVIVFLYLRRLRWESVVTFVSAASSDIIVFGLKAIVERPRPSADLIHVVNQLKDYSFPSGHVTYFCAFFGFLFFLTYTLAPRTWWRAVFLVLFGGLVALVGVSRVYEGQHWPSDVIASYLLGSDWLGLSILVYLWGKPRYFVDWTVDNGQSG